MERPKVNRGVGHSGPKFRVGGSSSGFANGVANVPRFLMST